MAYAVLIHWYEMRQNLLIDNNQFYKHDVSAFLGFNYDITEKLRMCVRSEILVFSRLLDRTMCQT